MKKAMRRMGFLAIFLLAHQVCAAEWTPVTGADTLKEFMGNLKAERVLANGKIGRGEYHPDGTGTLHAWGASIPRTWEVIGEDTIAITAKRETLSFKLERNSEDAALYRVTDTATGEKTEITVTAGVAVVPAAAGKAGAKGAAAAPSMDEIAAELVNPNTALATLNLRNQFRWFSGDLPNADGQFGYTALLQPVLPFPFKSGSKVIFRPAFPFIIEQPVWNGVDDFDSESGFGDIVFDLFYAPKAKSPLLTGVGVVASLPTASSGFGTKQWAAGPEALLGYLTPKHVSVLLPSHLWDFAGSGDSGSVNATSLQLVYVYLPGGGYNVGTTSLLSYDWNHNQWTVPLNLTAGKAVNINGRPWKLSLEINYYVEKADAFGAEWMVGLNIGPVVKNVLANWL